MIDRKDARELFFRLAASPDSGERRRAFDDLQKSGRPDGEKIALVGFSVSKFVTGSAGPSALAEAMKIGQSISYTDFNNAFFEIAAQILLGMGASMEAGARRRSAVEWGLAMMRRAMFGGFPISDESIDMMRRAKDAELSLSAVADSLIMHNESLLPVWNRLREARQWSNDSQPKKDKQKKK